MPVTAKLSQAFYERFGDQATSELVNWLNEVDATYRTDLRQLNELNFARFDAKLEQRVAELRAETREGLAGLRAEVTEKLGSVRSELIKWMFVFWAGTVIPLAGFSLALYLALTP